MPTNLAEDAMTHNKNRLTYADSGVDIDAGNQLVREIAPLAKQTARTGSNSDLGGFGGLFDLKACGFKDPVLVACNDGVGTKVKIAIEQNQHAQIGIDLVAMCVNDLIVQGAEPLFFLDYYATGKLNLETAREVVASIAQGCLQAGCALIGGETAEMPGLYKENDYDLAGFSVGAVERDQILPKQDIGAGDIILGLASNGVHSNGFSLVRRIIEQEGISWDAPTPFPHEANTLAEALLVGTRIYVKPLLAALRAGHPIKGLAHITGGGLTENLPRVLPKTCSATINLDNWTRPALFEWLKEKANIDDQELLKTFNCGIGMCVIVPKEAANDLSDALRSLGETVFEIGEISSTPGSHVDYTHN